MSQDSPKRVTYTPAEFAAIFGKERTWAYRQLYAGKVKAISEYGRIQIPQSEVDRLLQEAGRYLGQGITEGEARVKKVIQTRSSKSKSSDSLEKRQDIRRRLFRSSNSNSEKR